MNIFGLHFGMKKENKGPTSAEAIQRLRDVENTLIKKQEYLEKKIEIEIQIAKQYGTKNRRAAIQALKKKNRYVKQLQQIDSTIATLEMQRETLEGATTNTAVIQTMKFASDALKIAQKNLNIDQVHEIMDDVAEQQDLSKEISEAISNPFGVGYDINDDELENELERLEQEALDAELIKVLPTKTDFLIPADESLEQINKTVSSRTKPLIAINEEEREMNDLLSWAS